MIFKNKDNELDKNFDKWFNSKYVNHLFLGLYSLGFNNIQTKYLFYNW